MAHLKRDSFRWLLDSEIIPSAYSGFMMETIISDNNLELIKKVDDNNAIVSIKTNSEKE